VTAPTATIRIRRLTHSPMLRDLLVALVAFGLTLVLLHGMPGGKRHLDPLGGVLAALACFPLLARRRSPLAVFAFTTAASAALNGLGYGLGPPFGPTVALFFVASDEQSRLRFRQTAAVVLGMFAIHVGSTLFRHSGFPTSPVLFGIVVWGAAWAIGDQVRARRRRHADLVERARRSEHDLQRERRLAAAEERTRIARDLHDSAAHSINVILVQAGAARLLQQRDPAAVRDALTTIEDVARETIGEIDQLVRTLREDSDADTGETIDPPTGLAALETLTERMRNAGLAVEINVEGARRALQPAVDQAAYRILQESLTNAARHGDGQAEIDIAYTATALELTATNPLPSGAAGHDGEQGHGILGMRERATLLGGTLKTSASDGHFRLRARLPYDGRPGQ
jgi:signal transduction histidine kinase